MHLCLFEDDHVPRLFPLTRTRAAYDLRLGRRTILETTRDAFAQGEAAPEVILHARSDVAAVVRQENDRLTGRLPDGLDVLFVNGRYVAEDGGAALERLRRAAFDGEPARAFVQEGALVAAWVPSAEARRIEGDALTPATFDDLPEENLTGATLVKRPWDLLDTLRPALRRDFAALTQGYNVLDAPDERPGVTVRGGVQFVAPEQVFLAPGVVIEPGAVLDASDGPISIDEDAVVMANAVVRGPVYLGPNGQIKIGANIEGGAFGEHVKVAGEVHDSVIHSLSNKGHPGFLGHSYLGRWCNLGADTNTSNLKNDYGSVTAYDVAAGAFEDTGRQFAGLVMGDHSKCGINTMFNTGTVVDVFCNLYGAGFPPRYLPPFSWGSPADGFADYRLEKALRVAEAVMARRERALTGADRALLTAIARAA